MPRHICCPKTRAPSLSIDFIGETRNTNGVEEKTQEDTHTDEQSLSSLVVISSYFALLRTWVESIRRNVHDPQLPAMIRTPMNNLDRKVRLLLVLFIWWTLDVCLETYSDGQSRDNADDRAWLQKLSEREREAELLKRHEERERLKHQ